MKLRPFSGYCHIQFLRGEAAQAADTARNIDLMRPGHGLTPPAKMTPEQLRAGVEISFGKVLASMALVLLLAALFGRCTPARKAAQERHRDEHAAPAHGRYEWYWADEE